MSEIFNQPKRLPATDWVRSSLRGPAYKRWIPDLAINN